jgi:carbamoylphosphate synthase large subunit
MTKPEHLNIWFNRAFATTYWLIKMIKENPDNIAVTVYATHPDLTSPVLQAADFFHSEDVEMNEEEYVNWCINYCKEHSIHVFIPRFNIETISRHVSRFEAIGVKVICSSPESIDTLADKNKTYLAVKELGVAVPPWRIANSEDEFRQAYVSLQNEIGDNDIPIVIKPTVGVGAEGFKVIRTGGYTLSSLLSRGISAVTLDEILAAYKQSDLTASQDPESPDSQLPELMLLPWLESPEISVDCLSNNEGKLLKTVPRSKGAKRTSTFIDAPREVLEIAESICSNFELKYLTNTQTRWWQGKPVLLETNTRASGGMYSSKLTGVNLMWEAIMLAVTGEENPIQPKTGSSYIAVETFVEVTK